LGAAKNVGPPIASPIPRAIPPISGFAAFCPSIVYPEDGSFSRRPLHPQRIGTWFALQGRGGAVSAALSAFCV
jgi:hypothetical protein